MAEIEEPKFTSLSERIAALNQSKSANTQTFGKRPPPPIPTSTNRPSIPLRTQTINNPPIATYGSSVTKQANNQPIGVKSLLPPPPVDRDNPRPAARTPSLPARNAPPPLPGRKASQPSPMLPPRNTSTQMVRRGSNSSTISNISTISGMSLTQTGSSTTSASSVEGRKLPPPLEQAKLPPLPPTRREREEMAKAQKIPLVTVKSAPDVLRDPPVVPRDLVPKMPPRPSLPSRPSRSNLIEAPKQPPRPVTAEYAPKQPPRLGAAETPPTQPPRRLPPPGAAKSILTMGFNNKTETPNPAPTPSPTSRPQIPSSRPSPSYTRKSGSAVQELTAQNFDSVIMTGTPALVDFYAPYCKYCKELDPKWKELGEKFAFTDKVIIAKVDVHEHKSFMSRYDIQGYPTIVYFDGHNEKPEPYPYNWEVEPFTKFLEDKTGISTADGAKAAVPPPINLSSRPSMAQVQAIQSRAAPAPPTASGCLTCRDFSGPDQVAAQYPRENLPRGDMTAYLADVLCGSFTSHTDKARTIFTWLHHNIAYDVAAFFGNNVKHVDPRDTITTGLAVCGGYAGLYVAIALRAGLECVMVTGHGKGYGYSPLAPGDPVPPCNPAGHAWNAVRIDGGQWKLLDACWGAGNVGNQVFNKKFVPSYFTMSNDEFGIKHFPSDDSYFFRSDGGVQTWEKYMIGPVGTEPLLLYGSVEDHGLSKTSFSPPQKHIPVSTTPPNEIIRFQFSKACEHWDFIKNGQGPPYLMLLKINGVDGRKEDYVPLENNEFWWWADVKSKDLGTKGQKVSVFSVDKVQGRDARGLKREEYLRKKGNTAMGPFGGVCMWELV